MWPSGAKCPFRQFEDDNGFTIFRREASMWWVVAASLSLPPSLPTSVVRCSARDDQDDDLDTIDEMSGLDGSDLEETGGDI